MSLRLIASLVDSSGVEYHEWYLTVIVIAGLLSVALTMLSEIIDKVRIVYFKIRDFKKSQDVSMGKPSP
jgi:hypothetical protein